MYPSRARAWARGDPGGILDRWRLTADCRRDLFWWRWGRLPARPTGARARAAATRAGQARRLLSAARVARWPQAAAAAPAARRTLAPAARRTLAPAARRTAAPAARRTAAPRRAAAR